MRNNDVPRDARNHTDVSRSVSMEGGEMIATERGREGRERGKRAHVEPFDLT